MNLPFKVFRVECWKAEKPLFCSPWQVKTGREEEGKRGREHHSATITNGEGLGQKSREHHEPWQQSRGLQLSSWFLFLPIKPKGTTQSHNITSWHHQSPWTWYQSLSSAPSRLKLITTCWYWFLPQLWISFHTICKRLWFRRKVLEYTHL